MKKQPKGESPGAEYEWDERLGWNNWLYYWPSGLLSTEGRAKQIKLIKRVEKVK